MSTHTIPTSFPVPEDIDALLANVKVPDFAAWKLTTLVDLRQQVGADLHAARAKAESITEAWDIARNERGRLEARSADSRSGVTTEQLQAAVAREKRLADQRPKAMSEIDVPIAEGNVLRKLTTESIKYITSKTRINDELEGAGLLHRFTRPSGEKVDQTMPVRIADLTRVEVKRPKGSSAEIVAAQRTQKITPLQQEKETVINALDTLEMNWNSIRADVDTFAKRARLGVTVSPQSCPRIDWPTVAVEGVMSTRGSTNRVLIPDVPALLCRFAREEVLTELFAALEVQYEGVGKTYEPHERKRELKRIDAAILEAERIECEAIWEAIKSGDTSLRFRADTDVRALLGVA